MRKRYKLKKRACALCKPHKMRWENRWKPKERAALELWERAMTGYKSLTGSARD